MERLIEAGMCVIAFTSISFSQHDPFSRHSGGEAAVDSPAQRSLFTFLPEQAFWNLVQNHHSHHHAHCCKRGAAKVNLVWNYPFLIPRVDTYFLKQENTNDVIQKTGNNLKTWNMDLDHSRTLLDTFGHFWPLLDHFWRFWKKNGLRVMSASSLVLSSLLSLPSTVHLPATVHNGPAVN